MFCRLATSMFALAAAAFGSPVLAADWGENPADIYREGYEMEPYEWTELGDEADGLHFETGLRYWYSWGAQNFDLDGVSFDATDEAHTVEAHLRVEDEATRTYGKGWIGYSVAINGDFTGPDESGGIVDGQIGYGGADFGWNAFGDGTNGVGAFVGYNYWNNSPRTSRTNFTTVTPGDAANVYNPDTGTWALPGDSADDHVELHMLRLGLSGKAEINEFFDITAEVAAVPFATISGVIGGDGGGYSDPYNGIGCDWGGGGDCDTKFFKGSATEIEGWGYGGMAEVMAGIHPTENITMRLGGRAWYVGGTYDASYRQVTLDPPIEQEPSDPPPDPTYLPPDIDEQDVISTENPFSLFRYGLLAELTYRF